ncbi:hypothetical protein BDV12DRAFT_192186 [Aspergillus spectabilis]
MEDIVRSCVGVWLEREHTYGTQEALRVMRFEHGPLDEMVKCPKENDLHCDLRLHEGVDVYHDEHTFGRAVRALEAMRGHAPDLAARYTVYTDRKDLDARSCPKKAVGAIGMPFGSVWSYKFVTGLLEKYVYNHGLNIQIHTVVTAIEESPDVVTVKNNPRQHQRPCNRSRHKRLDEPSRFRTATICLARPRKRPRTPSPTPPTASTTPSGSAQESTIRLNTQEDWVQWQPQFEGLARGKDVWDIITGDGEELPKPIVPNKDDYQQLPANSTRNNSTGSHAEYQLAWTIYRVNLEEYNKQKTELNRIREWI